jgi:hypothetical protein
VRSLFNRVDLLPGRLGSGRQGAGVEGGADFVGKFFAADGTSCAGEGGGGVGEQGVAVGVPADAGEGEGADDEGGFLVEVVGSPRDLIRAGVFGAAVGGADATQVAKVVE